MSTLLSPFMFAIQHPIIVIACVIVQMVIGMLWYGPIFGESWSKMHGITRDPKKANFSAMAPALAVNIIGNLIQVMVLGRILTLTRFSNMLAPVIVVALLWLAFNASVTATGYSYMKKPTTLLAIDVFYSLVAWELMTVIILLSL
jgi:hypothetical protein